jgi:hypothetical protein
MTGLTETTRWLVGIFLGALLALVLYRLLTGQINTKGLFFGHRKDGSLYFSPERVQLLIFTGWIGLFYLLNTFETRVVNPTADTAHTLPDVGEKTIALLVGSHGIYLARKAYSLLGSGNKKGQS